MKAAFSIITIALALILFSTSASAFGLFSFYKNTGGWGFNAVAGTSFVSAIIPGYSYPAGGYYGIYPGYSYNYPYYYSFTPVYSGPIYYYNPYVPTPFYSYYSNYTFYP